MILFLADVRVKVNRKTLLCKSSGRTEICEIKNKNTAEAQASDFGGAWPASLQQGLHPLHVCTCGLVASIEEAADRNLGEMLMKAAIIPIPNEATFTYADGPSSIKAKIDPRKAKSSWADRARPTECGRNWVGPPFM